MLVTFSRRVITNVDPEALTVRLRSGALVHPVCATTKPADAPTKEHTILLVGQLGSAADPAVAVEVTGHIALAGGADGKGLSTLVTPLPEGPTLVLAFAAAPGTISPCPGRAKQIIVAIWAGGVKPPSGADQTAHLAGYRVRTATRELGNRSRSAISPIATTTSTSASIRTIRRSAWTSPPGSSRIRTAI